VILVDTSVWSLLLRRKSGPVHPLATDLARLIQDDIGLYLCGIIFQEILQGISDRARARQIKTYLEDFELLDTQRDVHAQAASIYSTCRTHGIAAHTVDCLIAATAIQHDCLLMTDDQDFTRIASISPLRLYVLKN